jgi:hypothetical protein
MSGITMFSEIGRVVLAQPDAAKDYLFVEISTHAHAALKFNWNKVLISDDSSCLVCRSMCGRYVTVFAMHEIISMTVVSQFESGLA